MTELEVVILRTLLDLESAARAVPSGAPPDIGALLRRLDGLAAQMPADADQELRHFLTRRSYEKARLHLQGRGIENARGSCGPRG